MSNKFDKEKQRAEREKINRELYERYEEDFRFCTQIFPPQNSVEEYLGELDADNEWSNNSEGAYAQFLNTDAYRKFLIPENLILMGRTGTGKSSILNMYAYTVNNYKEQMGFDLAITIKFESFFDKLKLYNFNPNSNSYIVDGIELIIKLQIMQGLVNAFNNNSLQNFSQEIGTITRYLKNKGIRKNTNIVKRISHMLDIINEPNSDLRTAIFELGKEFDDLEDEDNQNALEVILNQYKILLLADSIDHYDITEKKIIVINKTLVNMAFESYRDFGKNNVLLKVAIPSEVYTHIIEQIAAKRKSKVVAIEWTYKDIVKMLAIKIFYFFDKKISIYKFAQRLINDYQIKDFYDYKVALNFIHKILPRTCQACIPICFETLPYCIRHTQKKPRQIITIFNSFIEKICEEMQYDYFIHNSDLIGDFIHRTQKDIINDALNMYNAIAKEKVLPIVKSVLSQKRNFLDANELNSAIKDALGIYGSMGLAEKDIKQILIESGIIGQVQANRYVKENSELFKNEKVIKICIALFEYQIKDTLPIRSGVQYVLHPMCYEYYGNAIDHNALVYPTPADDLDDNILSKLEKENVIF